MKRYTTPKGNLRREARAKGLKRYRNGIDCKKGHKNPERLTSCGRCYECHKLTQAKFREIKRLGHQLRVLRFGFDPADLRCKRKARGIKQPSDRPDLVRLREKKRKVYGRKDRHRGQDRGVVEQEGDQHNHQ